MLFWKLINVSMSYLAEMIDQMKKKKKNKEGFHPFALVGHHFSLYSTLLPIYTCR